MQRRSRMGPALIAGLAFLHVIGAGVPAEAQITTTQGVSLLFFPKVVADSTSDTLIQIANTSNNTRSARCFYVDGRESEPGLRPRTTLPAVREFVLFLTPSQPTHWVVSRGRAVDPTDPICTRDNPDCEGAGFDPGRIPAAAQGFDGYALCVESDPSGLPVPGNSLVGKATVTHIATGDVATYAAIGFKSFDTNDYNNILCLGAGPSTDCPNGAEYARCPAVWVLSHPTVGSEDPVAGEGSSVDTTIALAPCTQDLDAEVSATATVQVIITNEFEEVFSAATTVSTWADLPLSSITRVFEESVLGSAIAQTRVMPADGESGFVVIAQTLRDSQGNIATTAMNLHADGTRSGFDVIVIPTPSE